MRMEDTEGQGRRQEPEEQSPQIESTNVERSLNSDNIFKINDKISVDVISVVKFESKNASAHPVTCQPNQLTIGQPKPPKKLWCID